jgi:hypothetical protein
MYVTCNVLSNYIHITILTPWGTKYYFTTFAYVFSDDVYLSPLEMSTLLGKIFPKPRPSGDSVSEIGFPTNVHHEFHVRKNEETGQLECLPVPWLKLLNAQLT